MGFIRSTLAACILFGLSACGAPAPNQPTAEDQAFTSERFEITAKGSGPDVILIPGLASNAAVWSSTVTALQDRYTLHTVQVSGFGGAPAGANADSTSILDDITSDLVRYTRTLDEPPALIGHSLGGILSLKVALDDDARIDRVMVIDVLPFFSVLIDENATPASIAPVAAFAKTTLIAQSDDVFAARQEEALAALVKDPDGLQTALDWSVASDRQVMAQAMYEVLLTDLRDQIGAIDVPLTAIYARDPAIPNMDSVEALYQNLYAPAQDLSLTAIDDAMHFIMFDQEAVFIETIEQFLVRD